MITGIGTDIIEVARIAEKINKEKGFRELIFSPAEIIYCENATNKFEHYAARFAAKESFFKALGTGWPDGTSFNEIEIVHDEKGKPFFNFIGTTAITMQQKNMGSISVSISHVKEMAIAMVIIES